jgi:hypothetical protein
MSEFDRPAYCPHCQAGAKRVITAPLVYTTTPSYRKARYLEEKSAHEPEVVVRQPPRQEQPTRPKPVVSRHPWAVSS